MNRETREIARETATQAVLTLTTIAPTLTHDDAIFIMDEHAPSLAPTDVQADIAAVLWDLSDSTVSLFTLDIVACKLGYETTLPPTSLTIVCEQRQRTIYAGDLSVAFSDDGMFLTGLPARPTSHLAVLDALTA